MKGLGTTEMQARLVTMQADLPDTIDEISDKVREILLKGSIQSISIKLGEPIVYQREVQHGEEILAKDSTGGFAELSLYDVVRNITMDEFDLEEQKLTTAAPQSIFFYMQLFMELDGWTPVYLLVAEESNFWKWMGIPRRMGKKLDKLVGLKIEKTKAIPPDTFIICGAQHRGATIAEVGYALKGSTEVPYEHVVRKVDQGRAGVPANGQANANVEEPAR